MGKQARTMRGAEDPAPDSLVETDLDPDLSEGEMTEEPEESAEPEYVVVEYIGHPPFGREFHSSHTIQKSSAKLGAKTEALSFAGQGVEVPEDLVWSKETGWIVKLDPSLKDLIAALRTQPDLKVHE